MNVIVLMLDSLRQDHVSSYGWDGCPVQTPHIDAIAAEGVVFDNVYPEGLPTIPVRTDLMTGQSSLTNRTWQPLMATDVTMAEVLRREGYLTALVADTYHLFYYGKPRPLSEENPTNDLLDMGPDVLKYQALMYSAPYLGDDERLSTWAALYVSGAKSLKREYWDAHFAGGITRIRPDFAPGDTHDQGAIQS